MTAAQVQDMLAFGLPLTDINAQELAAQFAVLKQGQEQLQQQQQQQQQQQRRQVNVAPNHDGQNKPQQQQQQQQRGFVASKPREPAWQKEVKYKPPEKYKLYEEEEEKDGQTPAWVLVRTQSPQAEAYASAWAVANERKWQFWVNVPGVHLLLLTLSMILCPIIVITITCMRLVRSYCAMLRRIGQGPLKRRFACLVMF